MKVGLFGGAFNPIHFGHLNAANEVAHTLGFDKIFFVVSARPPHKQSEILIDANHRLKMVKIACENNKIFEASDIELKREGKSYTIDTIRYFKEKFDADIFFIIGQDAIEDIGSWKSAATLLKTVNFVVVPRPGYDVASLIDLLQAELSVNYKNITLTELGKTEDGVLETIGVVGSKSTIQIVCITPLDISSTELRKKIAAKKSIRYLTPDEVVRYIEANKLLNKQES